MCRNSLKVSLKSCVHKNGLHTNDNRAPWKKNSPPPIMFEQRDKCDARLKTPLLSASHSAVVKAPVAPGQLLKCKGSDCRPVNGSPYCSGSIQKWKTELITLTLLSGHFSMLKNPQKPQCRSVYGTTLFLSEWGANCVTVHLTEAGRVTGSLPRPKLAAFYLKNAVTGFPLNT